MKIQYEETEDKRINARRSFMNEFWIIWGVVLLSCSGSVLLFNAQMIAKTNPWIMVLVDSSYVFIVGLFVSFITRLITHIGFSRPIIQIRKAARKVAEGDFTVRVRSQRKDDKKDEIEVLIDDFNKMVEELATIETMKGDFIANVSHEIKTPLAIIQSYASALEKKELSKEERQEYAKTILQASQRLTLLVTNILRLNKLDSQEIIQTETFWLDEQLRCCILALDERFEEKDLELEVELEEVEINSDQSLLEIVWNNLLTNAIKFTNPQGKIKVELKKEGKAAVVSISDTGSGMSDETCRHIFDRFYQGDTSHAVEGNGLGLSLVKRVIDLVEGKAEVESTLGKGSKFTITLY